MARSKIHVGLEIGTTKTCMVVAEVKGDGSVKILGLGETRSAGVRKGEITDYPQVRACVKEALIEAEEVSDVDIGSVFLAVTGSHIQGVNNRGTYRIPERKDQIDDQDVEEVKEIAGDINIPNEHVFLHSLIRHYFVDGQLHETSPAGLMGRSLEADFHIIHAIRSRIQNSIKCVREIPLDVNDVVFSPIASAQIALNRERKEQGSLVIDMGGGTTDYVLYLEGSIAASGCVPVGGDHVTNDIHLVTHIPFSEAERFKVLEGDASGSPETLIGEARIQDENGFSDLSLKRELLNGIIRYRLQETLELVKKQLPQDCFQKIGAGVFLVGGASLQQGYGQLANRVFNLPVYRPDKPELSGVHAYFKDPQYSTVLGLIRYAQIVDEERPSGGGIGGVFKKIWPFNS